MAKLQSEKSGEYWRRFNMLCPKCGKDIGDELVECQECRDKDATLFGASPASDSQESIIGPSTIDQHDSVVFGQLDAPAQSKIPVVVFALGGIILVLICAVTFLFLQEENSETELPLRSPTASLDNQTGSSQEVTEHTLEETSEVSDLAQVPVRKYVPAQSDESQQPIFEAIPAGSLGYAESSLNKIFFKDAIAVYNPRYNFIEVGLFELALPETLRKQVIKQGSFSKLRNAGPNVLVLLNFGDLKENITNNGLNGFSVTFHRRSSSTFNFLGSADIASFRRTLFDMGEQGTMELSGNVAGEAPFVVVKSQGQVERKGITETLKWKIEVKTDIIKAKKRKSSKVKR